MIDYSQTRRKNSKRKKKTKREREKIDKDNANRSKKKKKYSKIMKKNFMMKMAIRLFRKRTKTKTILKNSNLC